MQKELYMMDKQHILLNKEYGLLTEITILVLNVMVMDYGLAIFVQDLIL